VTFFLLVALVIYPFEEQESDQLFAIFMVSFGEILLFRTDPLPPCCRKRVSLESGLKVE